MHIAIQVLDRRLEVAAEFPRLLLTAHRALRKSREKRLQLIPTPRRELLPHLRRPRWHPRFVTIDLDRVKSCADQIAEMLLNLTDHMIHVKAHRLRAHLIALETIRRPLRRLHQRAHRRMAEAVNHPIPGRRIPLQLAVRADLLAQIDDLVLRHHALRRHRQHRDVFKISLPRRDLRLIHHARRRIINRKKLHRMRVHLRSVQHHLHPCTTSHRLLGKTHLLHRQFRRDPRPAARLVARPIKHPKLHPQPLRLLCRMPHQRPPRLRPRHNFRRRAFPNRMRPRRRHIR